MTLRYLPLAAFVYLLGCASEPTQAEAEVFGASFTAEEAMPATALLKNYTTTALEDTVRTTLTGTVHEVCQAKGCWMTVAVGNGEEMMVKFKDYGFFVPKDISGRSIVMSGQAYYESVEVDELRHLAEDGGKSPEEIAAITIPSRELRFLADGVLLK